MRYIIIGLSAALIAATTPAAETAQKQSEPAKPAPQKEKVYCIKHELTGSRMLRKQCLTKAEWTRAGVDIDDTSK